MKYDLSMPLGRATISELLARVSDLALAFNQTHTTVEVFDKIEAEQVPYRVGKAAQKKTKSAGMCKEFVSKARRSMHRMTAYSVNPTIKELANDRIKKQMTRKEIAAKYKITTAMVDIKLATMPKEYQAALRDVSTNNRAHNLYA